MPEKVAVAIFPEELDNYINKNEKLGEGGFAEVHLAEHKQTGMKVAIKSMKKKDLERMGDLHRAYREIEAMKRLGCHQHICQLYQVVETEDTIYLVMEFISGGELFDYIVSRERLSEKESRSLFRQIVSAVAYVHSKGLAHRDLKPENMLLDSNNNIKIIDFGLSSNPENGLVDPLATCCGSPAYAAPELVSGKSYFGSEADIWSLGVVLYGLLNGFLPFDIDDDEPTYALYEKIKLGDFEISEWLSQGSTQLLKRLLQVNPEKRITTNDLLQHPWLCEGYGSSVKWMTPYDPDKPDIKITEEMADYYDLTDDIMSQQVRKCKYDDISAHYFLLQKLRQKSPRPKVSFKTPMRPNKPIAIAKMSNRNCVSVSYDDIEISSLASRSKSCSDEMSSNEDETCKEQPEKEYISPLRGTREKAASHVENLSKLISLTPARQKPFNQGRKAIGTMTPKFAKRVGRRVANLMTPKKHNTSEEPREIKAVYKVSTTSTKSAKIVRKEIENALQQLRESGKIYSFESSRYLFKCKGRDDRGGKLIFQLEICSVPGLEYLIGIRHSRLRGDSWSYKKICDTILGIIKI